MFDKPKMNLLVQDNHIHRFQLIIRYVTTLGVKRSKRKLLEVLPLIRNIRASSTAKNTS